MAGIKETLVDWLRDAHAMETQAVEMLERQTERLQHYPELLSKVREHKAVSERQADRVRQCLKLLGTDTSSIKSGIGMLLGNAQSMSGLFAGDEVVKATTFSFAFEQWEIANYRALIGAAEESGELEVRRLCEESLREEQEMAEWLHNHLPEVTRTFLLRKANMQTAEAKR